ncbi:MAG: CopD family protein, partial [Gemmatimonadota bacterium]|nr:CopD family protein [Gemmatimonadota bacterium]
ALRLPKDRRGPMVAEVVNAFSPTALMFAGMIASTGVFAAWLHLGSVPALWTSSYGKTLLVKLAVLSLVACTGAYNWLRVKPHLGHLDGAARMKKSARLELAIGVLVVLVTAVLVALATPHEAALNDAASPLATQGMEQQ